MGWFFFLEGWGGGGKLTSTKMLHVCQYDDNCNSVIHLEVSLVIHQ